MTASRNPWPSWYRPPFKIKRTDAILAAVASVSGFSVADLKGASRAQPLARVRQAAFYLVRKHRELPYPMIGRLCGGRNHATVMHGVRKVDDLLGHDEFVTSLIVNTEMALGIPNMTREAAMALIMRANAQAIGRMAA